MFKEKLPHLVHSFLVSSGSNTMAAKLVYDSFVLIPTICRLSAEKT